MLEKQIEGMSRHIVPYPSVNQNGPDPLIQYDSGALWALSVFVAIIIIFVVIALLFKSGRKKIYKLGKRKEHI